MAKKQHPALQPPASGSDTTPLSLAGAGGEVLAPLPSDNSALDRLLDPVTRCLTPEVARELVALRADAQFQERLDSLADKCTEGELSADEREEYATYVHAIHFIAILQAKARKLLARPPSA
jgi:hypothetical protein